jgi:hypothetical protein
MAFFFDWQTFFHAAYVAFVFAVLLFGALAFRQVVDDLEVRALQLGEDRESFLDAPVALVLGSAWILVCLITMVVFARLEPSIYGYALPLILTAQILQLTLRTVFQRTQVKTRGLIVRSILFHTVRPVPYGEIVMVRFVRHRFWVEVRVGLKNEEVGFRIFSFSAPTLEHLFEASTSAPILWTSDSVNDHRSPDIPQRP